MTWRYKSKPTYYRGVYFRSKLEARWAAVFHEFGMRWDYESREFNLSTGLYTPDFWLPEPDIYVEIKPRYQFADTERYKELVQHTKRPFLFIAGRPDIDKYHLRYFSTAIAPSIGLLQAQFAEYQQKLWIADQTLSVSLIHGATPEAVPNGLIVNSATIVECLKRANTQFEPSVLNSLKEMRHGNVRIIIEGAS